MRFRLGEIAGATRGEVVCGDTQKVIVGVSADSRTTLPGSLFVAIRGARNDGHAFLREALDAGAGALMVERWPVEGLPQKNALAVVRVRNSLDALGDLAAYARRNLSARVIAITGTAGKTTTKEMTAAICRAAAAAGIFKGPVGATRGSENNLVGVPLTILNLSGKESILVLELGMNALGEIARLTAIADPNVGLITNVGVAHLEPSADSLSLSSGPQPLRTVENVARAKGELWETMRPDGLAVVNLDDSRVVALAARRTGPKLRFSDGLDATADVRSAEVNEEDGEGQRFTLIVGSQRASVSLASRGAHYRRNALAAAAAASAIGTPIEVIAQALRTFRPLRMRGEEVEIDRDVRIINDAYNANPLSMSAALQMLAATPGARRIAVLGDMRELGDLAAEAHREVGRLAGGLGLDLLLVVGEFAPHLAGGAREGGMSAERVIQLDDIDGVVQRLASLLQAGDRVLLKASRSVGLERVLEGLAKAREKAGC